MSAPASPFTALILAGQRGGPDPIARAAGVSHKALAPVAGRPMLLRVIEALEASPSVARIAVSIEPAADLAAVPELARRLGAGALIRLDAAPGPSASVLAAAQDLDTPLPLLVATADHPLLTPEMVEHFCACAEGDVAVALARASVVRAAQPGTTRTWIRLADGDVSGCNLFALRTPGALGVAALWAGAERDRKRPWRLVRLVGFGMLLRYLAGRLTLEGLMRGASRRLGVAAVAVEMPFAEAAIDVDRADDLHLAEAILAGRETVRA